MGIITRHVQGHSVVLRDRDGNKFLSSVSMDQLLWKEFKMICDERGLPMSQLVNDIYRRGDYQNLSQNVRLFTVAEMRRKLDNAQAVIESLKEALEQVRGVKTFQQAAEAAGLAT